MKKQLFLTLSLILALTFSSCNKDLAALDPSLFTCTPNPLEVKGGKINATITGNFPVKYFSKNAIVTVTPVLKFNGKEVKGKTAVFQGEKVVGNDKTISYKAGGSYTMQASFDYVPEMIKSELWLTFDVVAKKKSYSVPAVKIADGVISTSQLASVNFGTEVGDLNGPAIIDDNFQRIIKEKQEADILFLIQQSALRNTEKKSADLLALTKKIKDVKESNNQEISDFEISGYASPDGSLELNTNLAEKRQKVTADYVNSQLKKIKSNVNISTKFTAEDWDGFQKLMENSNIQDKQVILRVLSMYTDPEQREREIKNLSVAFKSIADEILPQLRRSRLKLTVDVMGKSDVEISKIAKEDASKLTIEELLYAGTLTENLNEKAAIYKKATELFDKCPRAYNNLGVVNYLLGNKESAANNFSKAIALDSKNANINYNLGLIALNKGDIALAEELFGKSAGTKGDLSNALGTISLIKGDYAKAKANFGSTATNNAALLQILNSDYNSARTTLSAIANPDAFTSYLGAIIGARTNNRDAVYSNLKTAVSLDKTYATRAVNDLEFSKFFTDASFLSILK